MWQTMPLACSYYRRPRLELCHGEIIPYLWRSGEKKGDEGKERERERKRGKGVWKRERERYTNENAYAPRTRRVPLIFLLRQRAPVTLHERMKISRLLCRETVSGYNSLLTSISHLAGPRICTKIRETSGR